VPFADTSFQRFIISDPGFFFFENPIRAFDKRRIVSVVWFHFRQVFIAFLFFLYGQWVRLFFFRPNLVACLGNNAIVVLMAADGS